MRSEPTITVDARGLRVALVSSGYHAEVTGALERGAREAFAAAGGDPSALRSVVAAGAFELPLLVDAVLARTDVDAAVAIGCIVRGETAHDRHLGLSVTQELLRISVARGKPVGLAVLTVESLQQARDRAGGSVGNKGEDAMRAALATARTHRELGR